MMQHQTLSKTSVSGLAKLKAPTRSYTWKASQPRAQAYYQQNSRSSYPTGVCRAASSAEASGSSPSEEAAPDLKTAKTIILPAEVESVTASPGVYSIQNSDGGIEYVGMSRKVSVQSHLKEVAEKTHSVKTWEMNPNSTRDEMIKAWKQWVEQAVDIEQKIPPGLASERPLWQPAATKRAAGSESLKLTAGKGLEDLTCSLEDLIKGVVESNKVVAFIKGTRSEPQCGFSARVLQLLTSSGQTFQVVNVLDETYNPGVRETIKQYSQWPTIPQIYVDGEFIGGADIMEELATNGTLVDTLKGEAAST